MFSVVSLLARALEALGMRPHPRARAHAFGAARDSFRSNDVSSGLGERARALARWEDDGGRPSRVEPRSRTRNEGP